MLTCNINVQVYVRLTEYGKQNLKHYFDTLVIPEDLRYQPDWNGYYHFSLWELMQIFGQYQYNGNPEVCFEKNEIVFVK